MKSSKNIRLFHNSFLESLTHVHPLTPLIMWTPILTVLSYRAIEHPEFSWDPFRHLLILTSALLTWSLLEYTLHRYLFHYPAQSELGQKLVYLFHGIHHDDPLDATRLVMPPVPALLYSFIFYQLFTTILSPWMLAPDIDLFFCTFMVGYLIYDYIHYTIHHWKPRTALGRYLRKHHLTHHAKGNEKFGVSSPLWDTLFHSMGPLTTPPKPTQLSK